MKLDFDKKSPLRIAVIGCGAVYRNFYRTALRYLQANKQLTIVALIDQNKDVAQAMAKDFRGAVALNSSESLAQKLTKLDCRSVLVLTPPHTHYRICSDLAAVCERIYCEKPFVTSTEEGKKLEKLFSGSEIKCFIPFARRNFPNLKALPRLVESLGPRVDIEISDGEVFRWPIAGDAIFSQNVRGSGVIWDKLVHNIDTINSISPITTISNVQSECVASAVPAKIRVEGHTALGSFCARVSWTHELPNRVRLTGSRGRITTENGISESLTSTIAGLQQSFALAGARTYSDAVTSCLSEFVSRASGSQPHSLCSSSEALRLTEILETVEANMRTSV